MTHKEYTLVVKHPILEKLGNIKSVFKRPGELFTVDKDEFVKLKSGKTVLRMVSGGHGYNAGIEYNRYNFENTVSVRIIETRNEEARLGQRKNKINTYK